MSMSLFFQQREEQEEDSQQPQVNQNRQQPAGKCDGGIIVNQIYGSTYMHNKDISPEMSAKAGKFAVEVAELQQRIKEDQLSKKITTMSKPTKTTPQDDKRITKTGDEDKFAPSSTIVAPSKPAISEHHLKKARMSIAIILNAATLEEARKAMRMFSASLNAPSKKSFNNSSTHSVSPYLQAVLETGGLVAVVVALEKWHPKSEECSILAMGTLATLVGSDPSGASTIAATGTIKIILRAVQQHPKSQIVTSDAIEVFCCLTGQGITRPLVATEECRSFVQKAMTHFPMNEDIQLEGCEYFLEIGKIDGMKEELVKEKTLGKLLGHAMDHFREDVSQRAIKWYSS